MNVVVGDTEYIFTAVVVEIDSGKTTSLHLERSYRRSESTKTHKLSRSRAGGASLPRGAGWCSNLEATRQKLQGERWICKESKGSAGRNPPTPWKKLPLFRSWLSTPLPQPPACIVALTSRIRHGGRDSDARGGRESLGLNRRWTQLILIPTSTTMNATIRLARKQRVDLSRYSSHARRVCQCSCFPLNASIGPMIVSFQRRTTCGRLPFSHCLTERPDTPYRIPGQYQHPHFTALRAAGSEVTSAGSEGGGDTFHQK